MWAVQLFRSSHIVCVIGILDVALLHLRCLFLVNARIIEKIKLPGLGVYGTK
jgi:hypothetical protein